MQFVVNGDPYSIKFQGDGNTEIYKKGFLVCPIGDYKQYNGEYTFTYWFKKDYYTISIFNYEICKGSEAYCRAVIFNIKSRINRYKELCNARYL